MTRPNLTPQQKAKTYKSAREYHRRNRLTCITHYSNGRLKCSCCNESIYDFLTIDHIEGGGNDHRRKIKQTNIYGWLIKNGLPEGFDVLCMNCNLGKSKYDGVCPHTLVSNHSVR